MLLEAYVRWGDQVGDHLLGDFVFAVWDPVRQCVVACRDHLGTYPLYHWSQGNRHLLSTDPLRILATGLVPRELNWRKLGVAGPDGANLPEETLHNGIFSLPGGTLVRLDERGTHRYRYWKPEIVLDPAPLEKRVAAGRLRELLFDAVESRLGEHGQPGCFLSGGLDSATITSIAAAKLARANRSLVALSAVLPEGSDSRLSQEDRFIAEYSGVPNIVLRRVMPADEGPFDDLHDVPKFESTFKVSSRYYLDRALEAEASACSVDLLLNGVGGETGPTYHGDGYYLELLTRFKWATLMKEARALRNRTGGNALRVLAAEVQETLVPFNRRNPLLVLSENFQREFCRKPVWRFQAPSSRHTHLGRQKLWVSRPYGGLPRTLSGSIPFVYPLLDKRLFEFCLALPGNLKVRDGWTRFLIREALEGVLPEKIRQRTGKCAFSPDYFFRYNAGIPKALSFLAEIGPRDPVRAIVDVERLKSMLQPVNPFRGSRAAGRIIPSTLYLINFLRQFSDFVK